MRYWKQLLTTIVVTAIAYSALGYVLSYSEMTRPAIESPNPLVGTLPHLIAVINATNVAVLQLGYRAIRRGKIGEHKAFMLTAFALITLFLALYVTRVLLGGVVEYRGPEVLRNYVYLPILFVHLGLSIISIPLVVYNVITGLTLRIEDVKTAKHHVTGKLAYVMWTFSLVLGVVVYVFLRFLQ